MCPIASSLLPPCSLSLNPNPNSLSLLQSQICRWWILIAFGSFPPGGGEGDVEKLRTTANYKCSSRSFDDPDREKASAKTVSGCYQGRYQGGGDISEENICSATLTQLSQCRVLYSIICSYSSNAAAAPSISQSNAMNRCLSRRAEEREDNGSRPRLFENRHEDSRADRQAPCSNEALSRPPIPSFQCQTRRTDGLIIVRVG